MDKRQLGEDLPRIRLEIAAMKVLCHQNICKLLQVLETDTKIYMVRSQCGRHSPLTGDCCRCWSTAQGGSCLTT